MKINAELLIKLRHKQAWSQDELSIASGLSLRTIQRIETEASASLQSKKALASVFNIDIQDLDYKGMQMKPCPQCKSDEIYQHNEYFEYTGVGEQLLPGLATGLFSAAPICPVVCFDCGYIRIFTSEESRSKLKSSIDWKKV